MRDIALLLDSLFVISSLSQSSLLDRRLYVQTANALYSQFTILLDANTIGSIASVGEIHLRLLHDVVFHVVLYNAFSFH